MCEVRTGVVVLGHGSRRDEANQEVLKIVNMLRNRHPELLVIAAFAEFARPNLEEAVQQLANLKVEQVIVVPLFLTVGNHLHRDIPDRIGHLKELHPFMEFKETKHLGADDLIVQLVEKRIGETVMNN